MSEEPGAYYVGHFRSSNDSSRCAAVTIRGLNSGAKINSSASTVTRNCALPAIANWRNG